MSELAQSSLEAVTTEAELGKVDSQYSLGLLYSTGHDAPLDYISAHKWLNIASLKGNSAARRLRREIADYMDQEEIIEAQRLAREWINSQVN